MKFRMWGTRGSIPTPILAETIQAKIEYALSVAGEAAVDLNDPKAIHAFAANLPYAIRGTAGGDTACVEIRSAGNLFILDCGSGIRHLGFELMNQEFGRGQGTAHIFISHTHWDHMMGWPFFVPGFIPGNQFRIYSPHPDLEQRFRLQQTAPTMFPVSLDYQPADIQFITLKAESMIQIGQTRIRNMRLNHPGDSFAYRFQDDDGIFVYASDAEYKSLDPTTTQHHVDFFRDADALIFDAMYSLRESYQKEDWGHSSAVAGADLATRAGVRRLLLFHHDPVSSDEEIWSLRDIAEEYLKGHPERPPCEVIVAFDGLEIELWREAKLETRLEHESYGAVVYLSGRLVQETAPIALATMEQADTQNKHPIIVDLTQVVHIDQDGIQALLSVRRRKQLFALSGLSPELRRMFAQAGALDHFAILNTPLDASLALKRGVELRPGQILHDRYKIGPQFSRDPLGALYQATDQMTQRTITLQVLYPSLGSSPTQALIETAQNVKTLRHPLIGSVIDAGQDHDIRYLALEHTPGQSVRQLLNAQETPTALPADQAVHIARQACQALGYAHSRGIVHGALRPENIILGQDHVVKVTHFGVGRLEIDKPLSELATHMAPLDYLAPEQLQGHSNSPASDLYALGTILYEMLTGQPPFAATEDDLDLIGLQLRQAAVPLRRRNPNLSHSLEYLVLNLLQKSHRGRPSDTRMVCKWLSNLTPPASNPALLGQDPSRQKLGEHLERVAHGESGWVIVRGPRGIGKSQLVLSVAHPHRSKAAPIVLHGELFAYEDHRPYKVFLQALRGALFELPAHRLTQLLNELGDMSTSLTALIPDLKPVLSTFAASSVRCEQLPEAISETLRRLTANGPVVLILDNLQWIDVASLRMLDDLVRQQIPKLLIMTTFRTKAVGQQHPLRQTLEALQPWLDETIQVAPLNPIDVHQMASELEAEQVPPDFGLWLYDKTEGNPLHVKQLIQAYLEGPSETRHPQERTTAMILEDIILRRLERLPDSTLFTLRQAAVLGHTFHLENLRAALDQPVEQVLADLSSALQAGFIWGHSSEDRLHFSHPLIREVVYTEMLGGVRKRYHQRAARALEQRGPTGILDEKIDLLAYHLARAGEHEKAVIYLARATRRARELCAYDAALVYIEQALEIMGQLYQAAPDEQARAQRRAQRQELLDARDRLQEQITQSL
jgi:serine/threonine protein kinase/ribonuclease BN (tRNA processing enzyme)/anti-anti-sigma regulatory factor